MQIVTICLVSGFVCGSHGAVDTAPDLWDAGVGVAEMATHTESFAVCLGIVFPSDEKCQSQSC